MNRFRFFGGMAFLALLLGASSAPAQTASTLNVAVASGNGQMTCPQCQFSNKFTFQPLWVRVTDQNGQPVASAPVTWTVQSGANYVQLFGDTSYTDANGYASFFVQQIVQAFGTPTQPFAQSTVVASAGGSSATFTLTQGIQVDKGFTNGIVQDPVLVRVPPGAANLTAGNSFVGPIGTTAKPPIQVQLVSNQTGVPVPNVAVQIVNQTPGTTSTLTCATQAGAGDNTVLTDQNGLATCNPVFGGVPNVDGQFSVSIGGAFNPVDPAVVPMPWYQFPFPGFYLTVRSTPAAPSALRLVSGSGQTQTAGLQLTAPLVVKVEGASGVALAGQTVNWTVSPASAASLGNSTTTTDANGNASNTVTLKTSATGAITVTASLQGSNLPAVTFTVNAVSPVTLTGLTTLSGNNQSALVNSAFGAPLVVQLNASNGPAAGQAVTFTVSGPATLSANSVTTGSNGQASVTVNSLGTAGNVTVTATAGGFTQTFNLTVSPPGPTLTANSFMNAADFQYRSLSPCSLATIIAPGIAPGLQGMLVGSLFGPLPYQLGGDSVTVGGGAAPIFSMGVNPSGQQQLTFQVPCDVTPGNSVPVVLNVGAGSATINIAIQPASPGIFQTVMSDGVSRAVLVRPDGTFVSVQNPARRGENLVAFATGLGAPSSPVSTNAVAAPNAVIMPRGTVVVGMAGRGVPLVSAQLSDELLGVWMVTFTVPTDVNTGNNVTFSISVIPAGASAPISSAGTSIPIQ